MRQIRRKSPGITKYILAFAAIVLLIWIYPEKGSQNQNAESTRIQEETETHPLVVSAREQIGVVTSYDTGYYMGGYPPPDRGACTDVIEQALRDNGYDLKEKIDKDMAEHPERYPQESDPNINYRRVRNVKVFLDHHATSLPICHDQECVESTDWQAGDIVTFDQIPGSLWHIAIVSNQKNSGGIPLLIHNYSKGTVEDDLLLKWPAPMTGHYRIGEIKLEEAAKT